MRFLLALALFLAMAGPASAPALGQESAVQRAREEAEARSFAVQLSRLEAAGQYHQLYELMHPDAKAVVSEAAVVGWYEENMGPRGPAPIQVTQVLSVPWIWQVTGKPYFDAVAVSYVQPFADGSADAGTVHLVKDARGAWGWFFGGSAEFVRSQEAPAVRPGSVAPTDANADAEAHGAADLDPDSPTDGRRADARSPCRPAADPGFGGGRDAPR